ncbi:hypothetical protein LPJ63_001376 [Coemansia sp. RSA 2711]|nr:hypothetical protein LPJ63_001376 [Coemansia sp. RSA 2711]KAJ2313654.1 hypothetical protein IWW54_001389 [Coemansia sp. RSA 2705]
MRLGYLSLLFGVLLATLPSASAGISNEVIESILGGVKGGILVKNGKRTSCELGVIDSQRAYVAKDCLDFLEGGIVDKNTTYEAYLDDGLDGKPAKYTATDFICWSTNPKAYANNICVIRYNLSENKTWQNMMSPTLAYNWDGVVYVRRTLRDMDKMEWGSPEYAALGSNYDQKCLTMSGIFQKFPDFHVCKRDVVPTPTDDLSPCPLPYGLVYGMVSRKAHLMGIYSYTSVRAGTTTCNSTDIRNYYILVNRHVNYANRAQDWGMDYDPAVFGDESTYPTDFKMPETGFNNTDKDVLLLRGDIFKNQKSKITFPPVSSESSKDAGGKDGSDDGSSNGGGSDTSGSDSSRPDTGGSDRASDDTKKRNSIIIGVCVGVGGLFLLLGTGLGIWWWRERHVGSVDPMSRNQYQNMLETDLGNLTVPRHGPTDEELLVEYDLPPVYDDPITTPAPATPKENSARPSPTSTITPNRRG